MGEGRLYISDLLLYEQNVNNQLSTSKPKQAFRHKKHFNVLHLYGIGFFEVSFSTRKKCFNQIIQTKSYEQKLFTLCKYNKVKIYF